MSMGLLRAESNALGIKCLRLELELMILLMMYESEKNQVSFLQAIFALQYSTRHTFVSKMNSYDYTKEAHLRTRKALILLFPTTYQCNVII